MNNLEWGSIRRWVRSTGPVGAVALLTLTGCLGLSRGETIREHYVLGGRPAEPSGMFGEAEGLTLGIRRLRLDPYLDTPFIVVRRGVHQVGFSDAHRWGESLGGGINRAVAGHLTERPSVARVEVAPWANGMRFDYLVQLHVSRFEGVLPDDSTAVAGEAHLRASWEIIRQRDGVVVRHGVTDRRTPGWPAGDYAALVALLDASLNRLSHDLSDRLEGLSAPRTRSSR